MDQAGDGPAAGEKPRGIFGRVFGGGRKQFKAAKMGNKLEMYYSEELKCWVERGEEEAKKKEIAALSAPPPPTASMATTSAKQEDAGSAAANGASKPIAPGGAPPIYGGARGTSRYASTSSFPISGAGGNASSSLLSGLKPTLNLPGGGAMPPAVFKPMVPAAPQQETTENREEETPATATATSPGAPAVEEKQDNHRYQEEDAGQAVLNNNARVADVDTKQYDTNQYYSSNQPQDYQQQQQQHQQQWQDQPEQWQQQQQEQSQFPTTTDGNNNSIVHDSNNTTHTHPALTDPVVLEVLSFWSYYRNCGYDPEAMTEWVDQNYESEYTGINYEELLLDPQIVAAVEQHISENKNTDVIGNDANDAIPETNSLDYNNLNNNTTARLDESEMLIEDALIAETAGEYTVPTTEVQQQQDHQYGYNNDDQDGSGPVASDTTLIAPPPAAGASRHHLPGAESGWSGFDDNAFEIEGGGGAGAAAGAGGDFPVEFGGNGDQDVDVVNSAYAQQYDQYGQYHTTEQYQVEDYEQQQQQQYTADHSQQQFTAGENGDGGETGAAAEGAPFMQPTTAAGFEREDQEDPTLGQVLGNIFNQGQHQGQTLDSTTAAGQFLHNVGGTLKGLLHDVASNVGTTTMNTEDNDQMLPIEEDQWGYQTPAAGPSPVRKHPHANGNVDGGNGNGGNGLGNFVEGEGDGPRFPLPGQQSQHQNQQNIVHPIFSPGQLAADLGVPREAVTMSALFAAEAASVGTLSSRESEDGWSDGGDAAAGGGGVEGGGGPKGQIENQFAGNIHDGDVDATESSSAAVVEVEEVSMMMGYPVETGTTTTGTSQMDVVGHWEAAAASIEATLPSHSSLPLSENVSASAPPPPQFAPTAAASAVAPVVMESKSTQADVVPVDTSIHEDIIISSSQYKAALLEIESLKEQLQAATATADSATMEFERSKEEAAVHAATLAEIMGARDAIRNEKQALEEEIQGLQLQVSEIPSLEEKCAALEIAATEQASSFTELEAKVNALTNERDTLATQLVEAQAADAYAATTAGELAVLQAELDEVKEALESRENECEDLKAALELKDDAIVELRAQETRAKEAKNQEIAAIESRFESQLATLRGELSAAREAVAAAEEAASDNVAAALEDVRERMEIAVSEAIAEKNAEVEKLEAAWREEQEAQMSRFSTLENALMEKDSEIMELRAHMMNQSAESEAAAAAAEAHLAAAIAAATADVAASKQIEIDTAQNRVKDLEKKFTLAKKKIAAQQTQQDQLTAEIQTLKTQLDGASSGHNEELAEMSAALSQAAAAQEALTTEASSLQSRLEHLQATKEEEIRALADDNSQLVQMIGERDSIIESLSSELKGLREQIATLSASFEAEKASLNANSANNEVLQQLQAELEATKLDISQWVEVAEDADARCTAAEEALAAEQDAREEAAAAAMHMQQELAVLQQTLASTEAQLNELAAIQEAQGNSPSEENATEQMNAEVVALRQCLSEMESELASAHEMLRSLDRGGYEDAVDDAEELRSRLAAASQVAAAKEEELLKYKKQLVKAKKLRTADLEKIAALEQTVASNANAPVGGGEAPTTGGVQDGQSTSVVSLEIASLREELSSLQDQLNAMRAASAETDESLNEALSALGAEELKVARLVEMLLERGMEEMAVEKELNEVDEMAMMGEEGEGQEEESLV